MNQGAIEAVFGAIVLAVAALFLVFAYTSADVGATEGYELEARFSRVEGISPGSDVRIAGVKVGTVRSVELDPETYMALVSMTLASRIEIPVDSAATITSEGLLGQNYLAIEIGAETEMLEPGARIEFTQSPPSLQQLLGQVVYSLGGNEGSGDGG